VEPRRRPNNNPSRTNPKGRWKNHGIASQRRERAFSPKSYRYGEGREDNRTATPAADPENSQKNDDETSTRGSPQNRASLKIEDQEDEEYQRGEEEAPKGDQPRPDPVQILNLHTETPMVSYRGQVFSCEWASNSGTELLFIRRDPDSQLPVLRSLPGEVDLLAASSCRIVPKAVTLEPKLNARNRMASDLPPRIRRLGRNVPATIPVGPGASQKRRDQAKFLEGLMAIKQERGEEDEITVIAQKRQLNNKWKLIWHKKRQADRDKLMKFIRDNAHTPSSREEVERARRTLQEMDQEDITEMNRSQTMDGDYEDMAYRRGRKRKAPPGTPDGRSDDDSGHMSIGNRESAGPVTPGISTPTSSRWVDAETGEDLDGNMEYEEYAEEQDLEGAEDDQGLYYDEEDDLESELYY
jgi:hypothetical protein